MITITPMLTVEEMEEIQEAVGATDTEVAAKARMSTGTLRRFKKGQVPEETARSIFRALDSLRLERIDRLQNLKFKAAR